MHFRSFPHEAGAIKRFQALVEWMRCRFKVQLRVAVSGRVVIGRLHVEDRGANIFFYPFEDSAVFDQGGRMIPARGVREIGDMLRETETRLRQQGPPTRGRRKTKLRLQGQKND